MGGITNQYSANSLGGHDRPNIAAGSLADCSGGGLRQVERVKPDLAGHCVQISAREGDTQWHP